MNIALQPCGGKLEEHYQITVVNKIKLKDIRSYLSVSIYSELRDIFGDVLQVWGVKQAKRSSWKKLRNGDTILFYMRRKFITKAVVQYKIHNENLAKFLWGTDNDDTTWEYIYFLNCVEPMHISLEEFNRISGYKFKQVQGFQICEQTKAAAITSALNLPVNSNITHSKKDILAEIDRLMHKEKLKAKKNKLLENERLDILTNKLMRKEQGYFRSLHFGNNKTAQCAICGYEYPIELLIAAHIKKRSLCTREEMRDLDHITVPMCKFGCDDLYERGYIYVKNGIVQQNTNKENYKFTNSYVTKIVGRECSFYNENTKKYFLDHQKFHGIL